jgi:hypothetical protein
LSGNCPNVCVNEKKISKSNTINFMSYAITANVLGLFSGG